jgi:hypothetical protein
MLKILIDNSEADLGEMKGITLQYNGNVFEFESLEGSYTIPFNLPLSDINRIIFGYPEEPDNADSDIREFDAEIWHSGLLIIKGTIKADLYENKNINCTIYVNNGDLYTKLKEYQLHEHEIGGDQTFVLEREYDYETDDFILYPVYSRNYFRNLGFNESLFYALENHQNFYDTGEKEFFFSDERPTAITPFPLLYKVLQYLFNGLGYRYQDAYFVDDYKRINIFNIQNLVTFTTRDIGGGVIKLVNVLPADYNLAYHMPHINADEFLISIQNFFNIFFLVQDKYITVIDRKTMLTESDYDDYSDMVLGEFKIQLIEPLPSGYRLQVEADENDAQLEWVTNYGDEDNMDYAEEAFDFFTSDYVGKYTHCLDKTVYQYQLAPEYVGSNLYFDYNTQLLPSDTDYLKANRNLNYFQSFSDGDKGFDINLKITPLSDYDFAVNLESPYCDNDFVTPYTNVHNIPYVLYYGNTYQSSNGFKPFNLRLMMYVMIGETKPDEDIASEPYGCQEYGDIEISAYWSYFNRWKEFIAWYKEAMKREYEIDINLKLSELLKFNFTRKKLINNSLFFVKSLRVQLLRDRVLPARATLIKF